MSARLTAAAVAAAVVAASAGSAAAQTFFTCRGNNGDFFGLHRVSGQAISLWSPGDGWSGNLCAAQRLCTVTPDTIRMEWQTLTEGRAYDTEDQYEMVVNRRSGTFSWSRNRYRTLPDGGPYPQFSSGRTTFSNRGSCSAAEDPAASAPLF
jgi:hypothetical protein